MARQCAAFECLPVESPRPDAASFVDIVMGLRAGRVPLVEYIVDDVVLRPVVTELLGRPWVNHSQDRASQAAFWDNFIAFWHRLGYDCVRFETGLGFAEGHVAAADPAPNSTKQRVWTDQHRGVITTWDDFERYVWPSVDDVDWFGLEYLSTHLPEGMGLITCHGGGVFEHLSQIMSIEGLCLAVYEAPDLVQAVVDRVGESLAAYYRRLVGLDNLAAVFQGDDMGFRTGTLIGPDQLRQYVLPWHKRLAAIAHEAGLPYFLHSCGNILAIMDDLVEDCRIDAKHSFEDAIIPVQDFQARYGDRIGVLGGVDINRLTQDSPQAIRRHTRFLIETCGARGRYAVGSGNSIPSYIPVENYLAMVDEAVALGAAST
ncbi:MAG TPA: uroporphyrinogen decarboxylase family protein [Candidatus Hydrogenedentes bacterium]|nr:uroporphyrinogen decarboxylase family protein [Candidatus Hydrogenedentota bacterium]HPG67081.1 uroporphyrinogen decarboxylase family protein [Candidatus Hydrogenedentota bacterium]